MIEKEELKTLEKEKNQGNLYDSLCRIKQCLPHFSKFHHPIRNL